MTNIVTTEDGRKFTLFFSIRSPFSNFHPCCFYAADRPNDEKAQTRCFNCTEQYYMYNKAKSCNDEESAQLILKENDPRKIKMIGKSLKNFDITKWDQMSEAVMRHANMAKYTQNSQLRTKLFCTHGSTLVECSPTDVVWGIGLDINEPDALDPSKWRGKNKLGRILTEIREDLWNRPEYAIEVIEMGKILENFDAFSKRFFVPPKPSPQAKRLSLPTTVTTHDHHSLPTSNPLNGLHLKSNSVSPSGKNRQQDSFISEGNNEKRTDMDADVGWTKEASRSSRKEIRSHERRHSVSRHSFSSTTSRRKRHISESSSSYDGSRSRSRSRNRRKRRSQRDNLSRERNLGRDRSDNLRKNNRECRGSSDSSESSDSSDHRSLVKHENSRNQTNGNIKKNDRLSPFTSLLVRLRSKSCGVWEQMMKSSS